MRFKLSAAVAVSIGTFAFAIAQEDSATELQYRVAPGDSLTVILKKMNRQIYGNERNLEKIVALNSALFPQGTSTLIFPGQVLKMPFSELGPLSDLVVENGMAVNKSGVENQSVESHSETEDETAESHSSAEVEATNELEQNKIASTKPTDEPFPESDLQPDKIETKTLEPTTELLDEFLGQFDGNP